MILTNANKKKNDYLSYNFCITIKLTYEKLRIKFSSILTSQKNFIDIYKK